MKISVLSAALTIGLSLGAQTIEEVRNELVPKWMNEYGVQDERELVEKMGHDNDYIKFKRWEEYWKIRVDANGNFPAPETNYLEYKKFFGSRSNTFRAGNWEPIGPNTEFNNKYGGIGRLNCVAFDPTDEDIIYVGSPSGGIWKTTTGGNAWTAIGNEIASIGVSDIVIDPRDPQHIYIATGDGDNGSSASQINRQGGGDTKSIGVLESFDGGNTFQPTGLSFIYQDGVLMRRLICDPTNPDILFGATTSGLFISENGGADWDLLQEGLFMDVELHPTNPNILYAATAGFGTVLFKFDVQTRERLAFTQFNGTRRIKIAVTPAQPDLVNLCVVNFQGGLSALYTSTDAGENFDVLFDDANLLSSSADATGTSGQGTYDLTYSIHPEDPNIQFVGGVNNWKSEDGGLSWELNTLWFSNGVNFNTHADKHFLAWHPTTGELWEANDGGVYKTTNVGSTWQDMSDGLQIGQIYKMAQDPEDQDFLLLGHQDNSTVIMENGSTREYIATGDGMTQIIHPTEPNYCATSSYYGNFSTSFNQFRTNRVGFNDNVPNGAWITPAMYALNDPGVIIAGSNALYRGERREWELITGFSANGNIQQLTWDITNPLIAYAATTTRLYRVEFEDDSYETIVDSKQINPGTSSGNFGAITSIQSYIKNGESQIGITFSNYNPQWSFVEINAETEAITNLSAGLPNIPMVSQIIDPLSETLFIGSDIGVLYYDNANAEWVPFSDGLPNVMISGLAIDQANRTLTVSTFGRGVWRSELPDGLSTLNASFSIVQDAVCVGDTLILTPTFFDEDVDYTWSAGPDLVGSVIQDGEDYLFIFSSGGEKEITLTAEDNQGEIATSDLTIEVFEYLPTPTIETADKSVTCSYADADLYVWRKNGIAYNQNSQVLSDPGSGQYSVRIEQEGFCNSEESETIDFIATSISDPAQIGSVYPNPVIDVLQVALDKDASRIQIYDLSGNLLFNKINPGNTNRIQLQQYPSGTYILRIIYQDGSTNEQSILKK